MVKRNEKRDLEIERRYGHGISQADLGAEFGLSQARVSSILAGLRDARRKAWNLRNPLFGSLDWSTRDRFGKAMGLASSNQIEDERFRLMSLTLTPLRLERILEADPHGPTVLATLLAYREEVAQKAGEPARFPLVVAGRAYSRKEIMDFAAECLSSQFYSVGGDDFDPDPAICGREYNDDGDWPLIDDDDNDICWVRFAERDLILVMNRARRQILQDLGWVPSGAPWDPSILSGKERGGDKGGST